MSTSISRRAHRLAFAVALLGALACAASAQTSGTSGIYGADASADRPFEGTTAPIAKVDIPASIKGIIAQVNAKEGQPVKKGDQLIKLDDSLQVQQVELARLEAEQMSEIRGAENQIEFARNEYDTIKGRGSSSEVRQKELQYKQSQLALDVQKDKQKQDQVKLKQQQITLDHMTLRSPIDGYVLKVNKEVGEQTDEGPVVTVVQTNKLKAVFFLPPDLFGKVAVGDRVMLDFPQGKATVSREGDVSAVDPVISSGLFRVTLLVDNADAKIVAGVPAKWAWNKKP